MGTPTDVKTTWDDLAKKPVSVQTDQAYRFVVPAQYLRLVLRDDAGLPAAEVKYVVEVGGEKREGKTDATGLLEQRLPPGTRAGVLRAFLHGEKKPATAFQLDFGLAPLDTLAGVQARLNALGFGPVAVSGALDDDTKAALARFQAFIHAEKVTGQLDDNTRQQLGKMHDGA